MAGKKKVSERSSALRERAEEMLLKQRGEPEKMPPAKVRSMFHELQVHQIELELQNNELRRTQEELEASREKYFDLYDLAPVGYITLNAKGIILEANLTAASLLGKERSYLDRKPLTHFIFKEDQDIYYLCNKQPSETPEHKVCEVRMLKGDGTQFWVRLEVVEAKGDKGESEYRTAIIDITRRKQAEDRNTVRLEDLVSKRTSELADATQEYDMLSQAKDELEEGVAQRTAEITRGNEALQTEINERKLAEESLWKSDEQFRILADSIPNLAWWANGDGYITWYNRRWYEYTGTTLEQMEGCGCQSVHAPKMLPNVLERWKASIATGKPFDMEFPLLGADGVFRPFLTRVMPLKDSAGLVLRWFGTNTNISELKQAEDALRKSEAKYRSLFENMISGFALHRIDVDDKGEPVNYVFLEANPAFERLTGLMRADIVGKKVTYVLPGIENDPADWIGTYGKVALTGKDATFEQYSKALDKWFSISAFSPLKDHFATIFEDITWRKKLEEELRRSNAELEQRVLERTVELSTINKNLSTQMEERKRSEDRNVRLTRLYSALSRVNEAIVRIHEPAALYRQVCRIAVEDGLFKMAWIGLIDPDSKMVKPTASYGDTGGYLDGLRICAADVPEGRGPTGKAAFEGKYSISGDIEHDLRMLPWREKARMHGFRSSSAFPLHADSSVIGALTVYSDEPQFFADEEIQLLTSLAEDVSFAVDSILNEKKRLAAEEALTRINEELERRIALRTADLEDANKELEAFSYSVSHDLRAPLRHMSGFMELLQKRLEGQSDEKIHKYSAAISKGAKKMDVLIEDLLAFSHIVRKEMQKREVNLNALVREVIQEIQEENDDRQIRWQIDELPNVLGDHALLRLMIINLLSNAVKFTSTRPQAEIEIGCKDDGDNVCCSIADNGVGFNMDYADRLFGVFQRLHTQDAFEGTGIGLANVQRIISRHGGRVWAEGAVGQGATFYFTLPKIKVA